MSDLDKLNQLRRDIYTTKMGHLDPYYEYTIEDAREVIDGLLDNADIQMEVIVNLIERINILESLVSSLQNTGRSTE